MRKHTKFSCFTGFLLVLICTSCYNNNEDSVLQKVKKEEKIFLIAGQSNASGVGDKETSIFVPHKEVYEYDSVKDTIVFLQDPVGQDDLHFQQAQTGSFIPALGYAYNQVTEKRVMVVQAAKGGSSLTEEAEIENWGNWSEHGELFNSSVYKTEKALSVLKKSEIDAIFWCQGENDGEAIYLNLVTKQDYKNALINLVQRYHNRFGEIPFIIVETGRFQGDAIKDQGFTKVREAQKEVAEAMENVHIGYNETEFFIEREWLKDVVHYNQEALNDIGKKLAYFYASLEE